MIEIDPDDLAEQIVDLMREHQRRHNISNSPYGHVCGRECVASAIARRVPMMLGQAERDSAGGDAVNSESVIIHNFWSGRHGRPIVFHKRSDPGTACDPENSKRLGLYTCGHALPRDVAEKIAQPCRRCYPVKAALGVGV